MKITYKSNNDLFQNLEQEYDVDKNVIPFEKLTKGSHYDAWWICPKGHSYQMKMYRRPQQGCPYCSSKRILVGFNDLDSQYPNLSKEYSDENELKSTEVMPHSRKKVHWICPNNHKYEMEVHKRTNGYNCPYCSHQKVLNGYNDLATLRPHLLAEWDYDKNDIHPSEVLPSAKKKVWWRCKQGHSYEMALYHKSNGQGCPICANKQILVGYNDLATTHPHLAEEWSEKNKKKATEVTIGHKSKAIWICKDCGKEWSAVVYSRKEHGCPYCKSSKGEQVIDTYLAKYLYQYQPQYRIDECRKVNPLPFDFAVFVSGKTYLVEFDGIQHFEPKSFGGDAEDNFKNTLENDAIKTEFCKVHKIPLLRIPYTKMDKIDKMLTKFLPRN